VVRRRLEHAIEPAFGGSYRSDDLCATAACEPRPYRALGTRRDRPSVRERVLPKVGSVSAPSVGVTGLLAVASVGYRTLRALVAHREASVLRRGRDTAPTPLGFTSGGSFDTLLVAADATAEGGGAAGRCVERSTSPEIVEVTGTLPVDDEPRATEATAQHACGEDDDGRAAAAASADRSVEEDDLASGDLTGPVPCSDAG
jgi:hypothetical protein